MLGILFRPRAINILLPQKELCKTKAIVVPSVRNLKEL